VDVYLPRGEEAPRKRRRMVAFVHGGAWGRCVRECVRAGGDGPGF
jgi:acetyl esterase/lipase